ncbi:SdiA-regulated domain-containing protein [Spirochaeta africana]|uniref:Phytase-like domain-containing protein n=1 Tax=Spirochaeta africana (strain ATCC 700263 / DSM 8902 / Z-7692) TaxID=889378 RepID=H9UF88_SPIAZ|nr:SdiA-regulated domain-containing protein [Spirochaeta africana]AFG36181.1 hypothetical protein Spiaf_0072 [Spirochaeta africana DSM 8902]
MLHWGAPISRPQLSRLYCTLVLLAATAIEPAAAQHSLPTIHPNAAYDLEIEDPSGLTLDRSGAFLWTVSDMRGDGVYAITFEGEILAKLSYEGHDLEGITQDPRDGSLYLAEERRREIVHIDRTGAELRRFPVDVPVNELNTGLEGIAFNPHRNILYLANQNIPRWLLEINLDPDAPNSQPGDILRRLQADFPPPYFLLELSGLWYDAEYDELWIVSDQSAKIVVVDSSYRIQRGWQLTRVGFEGIAVDRAAGKLYLVNDEENRLYVYDLPADPD